MPTTIVLPGERRIWLDVVQGVVLDASTSSVSVVHQDRDQRQFIGGTMILRPGHIHSEVVSIHKVWIRKANGQEEAFDLTDFPVDVRPGHSLALVYGAAEGNDNGVFFGAMNFSTGKFAFDQSYCERLRPFGLYIPSRFYRKRMVWGMGIGAAIGLWYMLTNATGKYGMDESFLVAGVIFGFILSLPVALVQAVIKQLRGQWLLPKLNEQALQVLLSKSSFEVGSKSKTTKEEASSLS